jgi:hypothetical protein
MARSAHSALHRTLRTSDRGVGKDQILEVTVR